MITYKIAVLVGSLRKESFNRKMANAMVSLAPNNLTLEIIHIGDLPLYNEDLEHAPPAAWVTFRTHVASFDGLLFVTPEYNRSVVFLNVPAMAQPEAYIGGAASLFDSDGALNSESTQDFMSTFMKEFARWVSKNARSKL